MHDEPTCGPDVRPVDEGAQRQIHVLRHLLNEDPAVFGQTFALVLDRG